MRKATRIVAMVTGITAGLAGMDHGVFEILHKGGNAPALIFPSMGAPCDPLNAWNACQPAMSIVSNFLTMGILTIILGLFVCLWSAFFIQHKAGGWITILLSLILLLFGGGFFPPVIGVFSGFIAAAINKPLINKRVNGFIRVTAKLWPWPLYYFPLWGLGQFFIGYYFNEFLKNNMMIFNLIFIVVLPLMLLSAYAQDVLKNSKA